MDESRGDAPTLTWTTFVAGHMAPSAVQTCVVDLSPLACFLLLAALLVVLVASSTVWVVVRSRGGRSRFRRMVGIGVSRIV